MHATIQRPLGIPPLGRLDARVEPMLEMVTDVPYLAPFDALPRKLSSAAAGPAIRAGLAALEPDGEEMEAAEEKTNAHAQVVAVYRTLAKSHSLPALIEPPHRWAGVGLSSARLSAGGLSARLYGSTHELTNLYDC